LEVARFFGFLHPALVHFPLVLLLVSVALEAIGFFRRDARVTWAAQLLLLLGTVATLFAFVAGNFAEIWAARDGVPQDPMEFHELLATITSWSFVFLCAGRIFLGVGANRRGMAAYLVLATAACVLLGFTGHRGAMLVYEHGAGVHAAGIHAMPTHEDLAVLRQKQDPDALFYSNQMHHIFGWMVMILSGMLLVDMVSPRNGARLRRFAPLLLLAGGVFLMIFSDQDSWPLYHTHPFRPITDKEVLMHKTYAVLMLGIGLRLLFGGKKGQVVSRQLQSRIMAVFALVGGALLFTHVHSNAPYANVAAGVYIHHTAMGFIALCIGAVKLLEDILLQKSGTIPQISQIDTEHPIRDDLADRQNPKSKIQNPKSKIPIVLAWAYPFLMLTESIFLINYNEGLPWFLGYRDLALSAPHQGLIAPLGRDRAELCYDPAMQRMDLYVLKQASDASQPIQARSVQAVVRAGTDTTAVELTPESGDPAHYSGRASFLRGEPMFETQVLVWAGDRGKGAPVVADFEPWTDARLSAPHTRLAYVCPMHDTQGANGPGQCPLCGMALVPNKPLRRWDQLHDDAYRMDLALAAARPLRTAQRSVRMASSRPILISPRVLVADGGAQRSEASSFTPITQPQAGETIRLTLTPRRADGSVVRDLAVVHTKKLHLIVASADLSFFDHIHPQQQPGGTLVLDYAFPQPGDYLLYADITPTGDRNQVFRLPVTVAGTPPPAQALIETPAAARVIGDYRVQLTLSPNPPQRNDETALAFTISQDGVPVTDLEPFLGAGGHCVILSEDTRGYLHSHPLEMNPQQIGPTITFHTRFPRPGLYKIWGQFLHHGKPLTADFVVRVN
jgi:uncharacterized membrane protein